MTLTSFIRQCKPGIWVIHKTMNQEGIVMKISTSGDKALVRYEDGSVEWNEYYLLDLPTPNP